MKRFFDEDQTSRRSEQVIHNLEWRSKMDRLIIIDKLRSAKLIVLKHPPTINTAVFDDRRKQPLVIPYAPVFRLRLTLK